MKFQIYQTVNVPENQQDDVTSGRVKINGREVALIAQDDHRCVFAVEKRGGGILFVDHYLNMPRDEMDAVIARFAPDGVREVSNSYCVGHIYEIPYKRRQSFLAAFRRLSDTV